ncbi:DNA-binding protein [Deinococcus psychrotolerans]|uniref:DNA-binding protein n=2 Tax=Deinococcus TaxID=1298 RepID=A0A553V4D5_9DEIO|nr:MULTISPECIES: C4-type zinc ribbon domain-containing protein [Deinococcus]AZI43670.1 DNA-binding protein [Deinococcus psychrotolerans]TSA87315.1 DNA-binding protein [Deinococcus detaillensis]
MSESGQLEQLYRVQGLDLELDRLRLEEGSISDDLRAARLEQAKINNQLEDTEIELEKVDRQARQLELDLASSREQVARNRAEQDRNATNAKLQSQFESVILQLSERVSDYEEALEPVQIQQTSLREKASGLRGELRAMRPNLSSLEETDDARVEDLRAQGEGMRAERAEIVGRTEPRLVKEYELIRKGKKGIGIVSYTAGRCQGCNVQLPVNIQQRAAGGKLPPVKCPSCGRILYKG